MMYADIFKGFEFLGSFDLRFEKIYIKDVLFIKDCYNANPISTAAALKNNSGMTFPMINHYPEITFK